jgi:hypothetical protein
MPFYELVFETGRNSVAFYETDEEAVVAVKAHHDRAKAGMVSLMSEPGSPPAERIVRVLAYDHHPNDLNTDQTMSADVLEKELKTLINRLSDENGVVAVDRLAVEVRALTHPMVLAPGSHDSIYKMAEAKELDKAGWDS